MKKIENKQSRKNLVSSYIDASLTASGGSIYVKVPHQFFCKKNMAIRKGLIDFVKVDKTDGNFYVTAFEVFPSNNIDKSIAILSAFECDAAYIVNNDETLMKVK